MGRRLLSGQQRIPKIKPDRLIGIDAFRLFGFLAVVAIHVIARTINQDAFGIDAKGIVTLCCRFAVPFFFVAGGFFLPRREARFVHGILALAGRLLPVFLCWAIFYLLLFGQPHDIIASRHQFLMWLTSGTPGYHLWFIPALLSSVILALVLKKYGGWKLLFSVAIAFYVFCLAFELYEPLWHAHHGEWKARYGPFAALIFVAFGYWAGSTKTRFTVRQALCYIAAGFSTAFVEARVVDALHATPFIKYEYGLGTVPLGIGVFMLATSIRSVSPSLSKIAWLGRFTLGMYAIHLAFILGFERLGIPISQLWQMGALILATAIFSFFASLAIGQVKLLRPLVR